MGGDTLQGWRGARKQVCRGETILGGRGLCGRT